VPEPREIALNNDELEQLAKAGTQADFDLLSEAELRVVIDMMEGAQPPPAPKKVRVDDTAEIMENLRAAVTEQKIAEAEPAHRERRASSLEQIGATKSAEAIRSIGKRAEELTVKGAHPWLAEVQAGLEGAKHQVEEVSDAARAGLLALGGRASRNVENIRRGPNAPRPELFSNPEHQSKQTAMRASTSGEVMESQPLTIATPIGAMPNPAFFKSAAQEAEQKLLLTSHRARQASQFAANYLKPEANREKDIVRGMAATVAKTLPVPTLNVLGAPGTTIKEDPVEAVFAALDIAGVGLGARKVGQTLLREGAEDTITKAIREGFNLADEVPVSGGAAAERAPVFTKAAEAAGAAPTPPANPQLEAAAEVLGLNSLPRGFNRALDEVAQLNPQELFSELVDALRATKKQARAEKAAHATSADPKGNAWARATVARRRALERVFAADPGPASSPRKFAEAVAEAAAKSPNPAVAGGALKGLGVAADDAAQAATDLRAALPKGVSPETVELATENAKLIEKARAKLAGDLGETAAREAEAIEATGEAAIKMGTEAGMVSEDVINRMALSGLGGTLGGILAAQEDKGQVFSLPGFALGALGGFIFGGKGVFSGQANFERNAATVFEAVLPDRIINIGTRQINFKRAYQHLMKEDGTLSVTAAAAKRAFFDESNGIVTQIGDSARVLRSAPQEARTQIDKFLRGEIAISGVPEKYRDAAVSAQHLWERAGVELIMSEMATGEAAQTILNNMGKYQPRIYLRDEVGNPYLTIDTFLKRYGVSWDVAKDPDWLKMRGHWTVFDDSGGVVKRFKNKGEAEALIKERKAEALLKKRTVKDSMRRTDIPEDVRKAWGEIKDGLADPGFLLMKRGVPMAQDIRNAKWSNWVASSEYALADDVAESAIKAGKKKAIFGSKGKGAEQLEVNGTLYRKMPDDKRFWKLRNRWVDEDVALDYITQVNIPGDSLFRALIDPATTFFKRAKVTWNPATLARNIYGQLPLNAVGGVNEWDYKVIKPALRDFFKKEGMYLEARKAGLYGGEWRGVEIGEMLGNFERSGNWHRAMTDWAGSKVRGASQQTLGRMERFHEASEQANKTIMYTHARQRLGMDVGEAVRYAKRYVFDYNEVPNWVKIMRKSPWGAPFVSFSYKALPRVLESAIAVGDPRKMMAFWKYPMAFSAVNEFSSRQLGLVPDEQKGLPATMKRIGVSGLGLAIGKRAFGEDLSHQKHLPDYVGAQQILIPWRDGFGRQQFWDLTWTLPWGDMGEIGKGNLGKALANAGIPYPRQLEPSNPWSQIVVAALSGGHEPFLGRKVVPEHHDAGEGIMDWAKFIGRSYSPALTPGLGYSAEKLQKSFSGDTSSRTDIPTPGTAIASEIFGIKTRPLDPRQGADFKMMRLDNRARELESTIARMGSKGQLDEADKAERELKKVEEQIRKLAKDIKLLPITPKAFKDAQAAHLAKTNEKRRQRKEARKALEKKN